MAPEHAVLVARVVMALTFLVSSTGKLRDVTSFKAAVEDFDVVPRQWASAAVSVVVALELTVVAAMVTGGPWLVAGFVAASTALVVFSAALVVALRRHRVVSCNCFGAATARVSGYDIVRNAMLLAVALVGALTATAAEDKGIPAAEVTVLAFMAMALTLVALNFADIARTLRHRFQVPDGT
jgi:uncharacterized membrane protein YphA (DoxX/SURF4 family)